MRPADTKAKLFEIKRNPKQMFKTDQKSLEKISFLDERSLANLREVLGSLHDQNLLTLSEEETKRVLHGLDAIGQLKLNGQIYAFHVYDSFAEGAEEGVELYLRQGNLLEARLQSGDRSYVPHVEKAVEFLKRKKVNKIYTGPIPIDEPFLGLPYSVDEKDPITRTILEDYETEEFQSAGIDVITLDRLI